MFWQRGNSRFHANKHSFLCLTTLTTLKNCTSFSWERRSRGCKMEFQVGVGRGSRFFLVKCSCHSIFDSKYHPCYLTCSCCKPEFNRSCSCHTWFEAQRSRALASSVVLMLYSPKNYGLPHTLNVRVLFCVC